jgi:hypothetical protein
MKALVEGTFAPALKHLEAGSVAEAVPSLVEIALTATNGWLRHIAQQTLSPLGSDASGTLLSALAGESSVLPGQRVFDSIAQEAREPLPRSMTPEMLAAFLAGEALESFEDTETAFAVINSAVAGKSELRNRAARVTARMSADAALPPLIWCALHLPSESERSSATHLLDRIVASDPALGMRLHHVQSTELKPGQLGWLSEMVSDQLPARNWMSDPTVCVPIFREAIKAMPDIVGEAGFVYSEPPTGVMASAYMRSMSALRDFFGGDPLPPVALSRHPQVAFPRLCRQGGPETLSVELLLAKTDISLPSIDVPFPKGQKEVELLVLIHAPGFVTPDDHKTIRVPRDRPSDVATFVLTPRILGEQAIDIKFMLGTVIIGQCCVVTTVTTEERSGEAPMILIDPVGDFAQLQDAAQAVLRVKTCMDGTLKWDLIKADTGLQALGASPDHFGKQAVDDWGKKQGPLIQRILTNELSESDLANVFALLSGVGHVLFAQIAPPTLAKELDSLQENALVVVDSDAEWIPWELLASHPNARDPNGKGRLWGERFVLIRAPVMTMPPNAEVAKPGVLSTILEHALLVVGDKIERPSRIASQTFRGMAKRAEPPFLEGNWNQLCANVAGKDIVHFACHGRSKPAPYHLSYQDGIGGVLIASQVHSLGLKWGAVVFANACSSGTAELLLADFQSFGQQFYYAGARPFIGTLGPVPEKEAAEFAGLFYEQFAFAGLPAGQAMRRAKQESQKKFKRPIWLFYCIYGNPSVVRRWSAA